ncbi:Serine/threonine-protein kinase MEC1 [Rhodotorula toruloides]|uniref:non-specific serine/threonine protein kinase n=1 Tax=Rhodotorula toruloides TaxID=5286 RepID=A0A0K3CJT9_RHOTO|nr:Serine/threonine-protein kinase MEC1 [Rhodotorula toruloides]
MPPVAGPSTQARATQPLPQATNALLHTLAPIHSEHFPRLQHAVQPDTSDIATQEQKQDAEQKIALLKSVLGGWMQGVEADLEGGKDPAATSENLVALASTLPGSFSGIKAKPRFLLYTSRSSPFSTARVPPTPSLVNGSPRKDAAKSGPSLQPAAGVEGIHPEEDLATFLVCRSLSVSSRLQAALFDPAVEASIDETVRKVAEERAAALRELESLVQGIVEVLCESAVRVEWRAGVAKDDVKSGGVGKAKEIVEELIRLIRTLLPKTASDEQSYPRTFTLFESSRAYQPTLRSPSKAGAPDDAIPRRPSLTVKMPLHAISLVLVSLRILLAVTASTAYLAEYRLAVLNLLLSSWPVVGSLRPAENDSTTLSRKGKERASEEMDVADLRRRLAVEWLECVRSVLQRPHDAFASVEVEATSVRVLDELSEALRHPRSAGEAGLSTERLEVLLAENLALIWKAVTNAKSATGQAGGFDSLQQHIAALFAAEGTQLIEVFLAKDGISAELKIAVALVLSLAVVLEPAEPSETTSALLDTLPPSALSALEQNLARLGPKLIHDCPDSLAAVSRIVNLALAALKDEMVDRNPRLDDVGTDEGPARKRRRLGDAGAAPEIPMDVDDAPTRMRRPFTEVVARLMEAAKTRISSSVGSDAAKVLEAAGEATEQTAVRLISTLHESTPALAAEMIRTIGLLSCAQSGCLDFASCDDSADTPLAPSCACCDSLKSPTDDFSTPAALRSLTRQPLEAFAQVAPAVLAAAGKDDKLRLAVLNAAARLVRHTGVEHASLAGEKDALLVAVQRELEGSSRSGRLAARHVLVAVAQARQEQDAGDFLLRDLFKPVDSLIARENPSLTETALQLVGSLARVAEPQGLLECEALARLLRLLGHRNSFIKSLAKLQITQVASHRGIKPYALVQPHFATLSPALLSSTTTLTAALEVFHQSRESLLRITREHTIPGIILHDKQALLCQVAEASRTTIPEMLCDPPVASAVLAHLYMQPDDQRQRGLKVLMRECRGVVLAKLLESINIPLVYKLALELGDEDQMVAAQAERGLKAVERARLGHAASAHIDPAHVLKNAIVGILSHMNRGLHEAGHQRPLREKQKIIRSLDAITRMVGRAIAGFSPQIMATLQTALELPGLRLVTLNAFRAFLQSLKFSDIGAFIGPTTAAFVRLWPDLTNLERASAAKTIHYLVVENVDSLSQHVKDVADLSGIPELAQADRRLQAARRGWSLFDWLRHLLDRIASENDVVTLQALRELKVVLAKNVASIQALATGDTFDPAIGRLVSVLLSAAVKDSPENESIRNVAFECIGILGAVDPDRFELPPVEPPPVVLENFDDRSEAIDFAIRLIEDLLVGAYRSTNDTKHQEMLAYAIQELLRFCGFTEDLIISPQTAAHVDPLTLHRWQKLPKTVIEACAPLLSTRFSLANDRAMQPATFPIYLSTTVYRDWIRAFANELLKGVRGETAGQVFGAFSGLLHLEDTAVAQHLLPHLVLHVVICGSDEDRLNIKKEMETVLTDQVSPTHTLSENSRLLAAQTVFSLMDHVSRWITLARKRLADAKALRKKTKSKPAPIESKITQQLGDVEGILQDIPHILVGQAALTCKAYARSLLNFESHIVAQRAQKGLDVDKDLQVYYENLHECYAHLDEPDGMEGISTKILSPSILHQIREHESTGRWTSAQSCWEVKLQQKPDEPGNHVGLLRCLRNLGHYDSMRTHIAGLLHGRGDEVDWERILAPFNIEASLFVGDWDAIEDVLEVPGVEGAEAAFGRVLSAIRTGDRDLVERAFYEAREQLGGPLVAAGRESYRRVYDSVVHLHILDELSLINELQVASTKELPACFETLKNRLDATSPSFRAREPILNLRRTALRLTLPHEQAAKTEVGNLWLETSKIARKAGHFQTAYSAILQARDYDAEYTFLQSAKLFKANDQPFKAIQELDNRLKPILARFNERDPNDPLISHDKPGPIAKAALRRARWMQEAGRLDQNEAVSLYNEATALAPNWETAYFHLGRFWDRMAQEKEKKQPKHKQGRYTGDIAGYRCQVVKLYVRSLACGTKYIYQALPRTLTIWLEMGERPALVEHSKNRKSNPQAALDGEDHDLLKYFTRCNGYIRKAAVQQPLPAYLWLTVLPQLVSRILHANETLYDVLEQVLLKVLSTFPHHGFWAMASGAKSNTNRRSRRNMRIFQKAKEAAAAKHASDVGAIVDEGLRLVDQLLVLCNFPINGKVDTLSLKKTFPQLYKTAPCKLIIPLQSSLTVSLPFDASQAAAHKPFPDSLPVFQDFDDQIVVMSSLQKPRKITVRGDDGRFYSFLCKPKDDLRKDARLMEFNAMIIKLLKKDSDARSRKLNIRTYSVVPLNEECGLIEWVPHTVVLRGLLNKSYLSRGIASWSPELKRIFDSIRDDQKRIGERFDKEVLSMFPPVFHDWFLETFPEPSAWHRARLAYSRTAAVISMVGFVLGLGDRHCENILLDATTGETVQVDFNCLFDKGRTFEVPEKVPFRLTQNIIDGMGVTGFEGQSGVYRRACEITLRILRANRDSLRSVLETFLHDPLVEWVYVSKKQREAGTGPEQTRARALEALEPIDNKLLGLQVTSDPESIGVKEVSVEEQVERLIREARDSKNLGAMYVGWCAWY